MIELPRNICEPGYYKGDDAEEFRIDPEHMCHGVMVDEPDGRRRLVKVTAGQEYEVPNSSTSLWEYSDGEGNVRACLLRVGARTYGPIWNIHADAGQDVGQPYYEVHQAIAGRGDFVVVPSSPNDDKQPNDYPLYTLNNILGGLCIHAGDRFTVDASRTFQGDAWVLATFPGAPFKMEYETREG